MNPPPFRRKKKIILPRLQLRLIGLFTGLAALGILLEFLLVAAGVDAAMDLAHERGESLSDVLPGVLLSSLALTLVVVLPLIVMIGIQVTHRIAGPIYRFDQHLGAIARGEDPGECRIRSRDEFEFICRRINAAVARLRGVPSPTKQGDHGPVGAGDASPPTAGPLPGPHAPHREGTPLNERA